MILFIIRLIIYPYSVIVLVSRSTQVTSVGGSYKSKNLESTPIRNGNGACKTSAKLRGHNGIYGHCHLNGNISWKLFIKIIIFNIFFVNKITLLIINIIW